MYYFLQDNNIIVATIGTPIYGLTVNAENTISMISIERKIIESSGTFRALFRSMSSISLRYGV